MEATTTVTVTASDGSVVPARDARHARAVALDAARRTGRAEVHRVGLAEADGDGRDATPRFLVGTAWATPTGADPGYGRPPVFVRWRSAAGRH